MTTVQFAQPTVTIPTDVLTPAQKLVLVTDLMATLCTLSEHLAAQVQQDTWAQPGDRSVKTIRLDLERMGLNALFGPDPAGNLFIVQTAPAFLMGFRLYAEDMAAQGAEGCL